MSRPTKTLIGKQCRQKVLEGVNAIYFPVRLTLGPESKKALLYRTFNRGSRIVDDGYTVAECQEPKDESVRLASQAFKETCKKTNEKVGDGTTTTTVIGGKLFNDIYSLMSEGVSDFTAQKSGKIGVSTLRRKILDSAMKVKEEIEKLSTPITTLEQLEKIAIISLEEVELGKIVAKMAWEVGVDGFIETTEGYKGEIETEIIKGMRFPAKVGAKAFVNNPVRYEMIVKDCAVLITNYALDNAGETAPLFQAFNQKGVSKIIVMSPSFGENVLINMVNATKEGFSFHPVAVPALRTEQFEDLAIYCGANFIDKNKGKSLKNVKVEDLGFLEKLIVKDTEAKEDATATGGRGTQDQMFIYYEQEEVGGKKIKVQKEKFTTAIKDRIETLKGQLEETKQDNFKKLMERRIASMGSSVGIIRVGDVTNASALYRKLKIEDAVYACKAALRGGYVKGGGLCLKEIADKMPDDDILKDALIEPYNIIQSSVDEGVEITDDIIDPTEMIYYAVEHATSVVANLVTVEIITSEIDDPIHGEGEFAIAQSLYELNMTMRRQYGFMKENEEEAEKDRLHGLTKGLSLEEYTNQENG